MTLIHLARLLNTQSPYGVVVDALCKLPHWNGKVYGAMNCRSARNAIKLCRELGVVPAHIIDAGANESQWAIWFVREWPSIRISSVEPFPTAKTRGGVFVNGLSDHDEMATLEWGGRKKKLNLTRLESLPVSKVTPLVIKIDCEDYTAKVMRGCGQYLDLASVVVVEMWNGGTQQAEVWECALSHGLRLARVIDCNYAQSKYDIAFYRELCGEKGPAK